MHTQRQVTRLAALEPKGQTPGECRHAADPDATSNSTQVLMREPSLHVAFGSRAPKHVDGFDLVLQWPHDVGNFVGFVAGAVKLEVGDGANVGPNRIAVHAHDERDEGPCLGKQAQDVLLLGGDLGATDGNETYVIRPGLERQLPQRLTVDGSGLWAGTLPQQSNRRMVVRIHG